MKALASSLVLFGTLLGAVTGLDTRLSRRQDSDKEVQAHFETVGYCFHYLEGGSIEKGNKPCHKWCEKKGEESLACYLPLFDEDEVDPSIIDTDDNGDRYIPGECKCGNPQDYYPLLEPVVEALAKLDDVICGVFTQSVSWIVEGAIDLIPGGAALTGAKRAVQAAKTFAENGLSAAAFFDDWVGDACGIKDWGLDKTDAFGKLNEAPDGLGVSKGCFQKKKKNCKVGGGKGGKGGNDGKDGKDGKDICKVKRAKDGKDGKDEDCEKERERERKKKEEERKKKKEEEEEEEEEEERKKEDKDKCKANKGKGKEGQGCSKNKKVDCSKVKALEEKGTGEGSGDLVKRQSFVSRRDDTNSRSVKAITICGDLAKVYYPSGPKLIKAQEENNQKTDKIIFAFANPGVCKNWDYGRQGNDKFKYFHEEKNLKLESEHVLEGQMITDFFKLKIKKSTEKRPSAYKKKGEQNLCDYLDSYWRLPSDVGIKIGGEDVPQPKTWLVNQLPNMKEKLEEFVLVPGEFNSMKARFWGQGRISAPTTGDQTKLMKGLRDDGFIDAKDEALEESKFYESYKSLKIAWSIAQYHNDDGVRDILKKQTNHIADGLEKVEKALKEAKFENKKRGPINTFVRDYEKLGLKKEWNEWMKKSADDTIEKAKVFYKDHAGVIEKRLKDLKEKKQGQEEEKKKAKKGKEKEKIEKKVDRIEEAIELLEVMNKKYQALKGKEPWTNPLA